MPSLSFLTLDVFTDTRYLGNPLAIVRIPPGHPSPPTQAQKQAIAKEFNLSETIFLHETPEPPADAEEETVQVDIFTLDQELPFAGHPTVGAGFYLHTLRPRSARGNTPPPSLSLLTKAGPIPVRTLPGDVVALTVPHDTHLHKAELVSKEMLSLFPTVAHEDYHLELCSVPVFSVVKGMTFALPRLASLEALGRVTPSPNLAAPALDAPWDGGLVGVLFYVVISREATGDMWVWKIRSRMILGLLEDPATGSASCALAAYLALVEGGRRGVRRHRFELVQGVEIGRESRIGVEVELEGGARGVERVERVVLSGTAVKVMEGVIEY